MQNIQIIKYFIRNIFFILNKRDINLYETQIFVK